MNRLVFVPNFPPPSFRHKGCELQSNQPPLISNNFNTNLYKMRLKTYLECRKSQYSKQLSNLQQKETVKISEISTELSQFFSSIETINAEIQELFQSASSVTNYQWDDQISNINVKIQELSTMCIKYRDPNLRKEAVLMAQKRLSKRKRIKERKKETKGFRTYEKKIREIKNQQVNHRLEQLALKIHENRSQIENIQRAEEILAEVKGRKNEAEKFLKVFDFLKELYRVRSRNSGSNEFNQGIEDLRYKWLDALKKYATEEATLLIFLQCSNIWDNWKDTIFYNHSEFYLEKKGNSLNHLITIRRLWDSCIASHNNGTSLPFGWVIPNEHASDKWLLYVKND